MAAAMPLVQPGSAISSIAFHYGYFCPIGYFCALALPTHGYVVFDMAEPGPDLRVAVAADEQGIVAATMPVPMPAASAAS